VSANVKQCGPPRVALADCVGSNKAKAAMFADKIERAPKKMRDQISIAM
jgi:hypothetical protein